MMAIPSQTTTLTLKKLDPTAIVQSRTDVTRSMIERLQQSFIALVNQNMELKSAIIAAQSREREYTMTHRACISALQAEVSSLKNELTQVEDETAKVNKRRNERLKEIPEEHQKILQEMNKMHREKCEAAIKKINAILRCKVQEEIHACEQHLNKIESICDEAMAFAQCHPGTYFPGFEVGGRFIALREAAQALCRDPNATWAADVRNTWL